jgi:hypothetical protein
MHATMAIHPLPFLLLLASASGMVSAGDRPQHPAMTAEDLAPYMPDGARIETRLDADLTGDGVRDLAFVAANDDVRVLKVMLGYADEFSMGFDPADEMRMGDSPLGPASLSVKKGVLIVEDLDGGTTAIQSLYRFRFDPKKTKMRLIGDDVSLYSRTNAHGMTRISTNRITGVQIVKRSEPGTDGYVDAPEEKKSVPKTPIWMEDAPTPAKTLDWGD